MRLLRYVTFLIVSLLIAACAGRQAGVPVTGTVSDVPEFRVLWVDGFHAGIRSAEEVAQLIRDAKRADINTLIVQVRRRGDALYARSFEPPVEDAAYDGKFDGLAAILEAAHAEGMEVQAWINAADRFDYLSQGADAPFARPAPIPRMPWIEPENCGSSGMHIPPRIVIPTLSRCRAPARSWKP